ncbi:MAG: hypothetical protein GY859_33055, partial [Desulfobacterales bacterium]|nr:hypothetical protein [Desulfobacterales bacterium]
MKSLMKISLSLLVLSSLFAASAWAADPSAVIKANGSDGPVSITTNDNLSLTVALDPGSLAGDDADWWMLQDGPSGL